MADPHIHTTGTIRITTLFEKGGCYAEGGFLFYNDIPHPVEAAGCVHIGAKQLLLGKWAECFLRQNRITFGGALVVGNWERKYGR